MSSLVTDLNKLEDLLYDQYDDPIYKQEIKWKLITKPRDEYEEYHIPADFDEWFRDMGGLEHPRLVDKDQNPIMITKLAPYQSDFAKEDWAVMKKGNKLGVTTSELLGDFHTRLMPKTAGKDCLFTTASETLSKHLLDSAKYAIGRSPKYRRFMLKKTNRVESNEEATMTRMIIDHPWRDGMDGHILALGTSLSSAYSRTNVNRVHISDPSKIAILSQDNYFSGILSRITNTSGQIKIEGVPGETRTGWFWKLCRALFQEDHEGGEEDEQLSGQADEYAKAYNAANESALTDYEFPPEIVNHFKAYKVTIDDGVEHNVVSAEQREKYRTTFPPAEYARTFMAVFPPNKNAAFRARPAIGTHPIAW